MHVINFGVRIFQRIHEEIYECNFIKKRGNSEALARPVMPTAMIYYSVIAILILPKQ